MNSQSIIKKARIDRIKTLRHKLSKKRAKYREGDRLLKLKGKPWICLHGRGYTETLYGVEAAWGHDYLDYCHRCGATTLYDWGY